MGGLPGQVAGGLDLHRYVRQQVADVLVLDDRLRAAGGVALRPLQRVLVRGTGDPDRGHGGHRPRPGERLADDQVVVPACPRSRSPLARGRPQKPARRSSTGDDPSCRTRLGRPPKALYGDDTPETKTWARTTPDRLWQSGPKPVLDWFDATQPGTTTAAAVLKRERGYFSSNAARMEYPSLRATAAADRLRRCGSLGQAPRSAAYETQR